MRTLVLAVSLVLLAGGASADSRSILDYRDPAVQDAIAASAPRERDRLVRAVTEEAPAALRQELGAAFVVLGDAPGAFTRPGARERAFLVQKTAPVAIDPFPQGPAPTLVVLTDAAPARFFRLPADTQYRRLAAAVDADGDGRSEILLESSFMNMGELTTAITVVRLDPEGMRAAPVETIRDVYADSCDGGARRKRRSAASLGLDRTGRLAARRYDLGCR